MKAENLFFLGGLALITGTTVTVIQVAEVFAFENMVFLQMFLAALIIAAFIGGLKFSNLTSRSPGSERLVNMASLTAREMDIFFMLYSGKTNKEIASIYFIEVSTVKTHINNLYTKLQVANRKEARELYKNTVNTNSPSFIHPV